MSNCTDLTKAKEKILYKWYKNDYKGTSMIANFVNKEIKKIGGISQKDHDNFHSLANEVFFKSLKTWDEKRSFYNFFKSNFGRKLATELRNMNCTKRGGLGGNIFVSSYDDKNDPTGEKRYKEKELMLSTSKRANTLSLDFSDNEDFDMYDTVYGGNNIEDYFFGEEDTSEAYEKFFNNCSRQQRKIIQYKIDNPKCLERELCKELGISSKTYHQQMNAILNNEYLFIVKGNLHL